MPGILSTLSQVIPIMASYRRYTAPDFKTPQDASLKIPVPHPPTYVGVIQS